MSSASQTRKLVCQRVSPDFEKAVEIITVDKPVPKENEILVKTRFAGVNASDVNITAARYITAGVKVPFDVGLEGVGVIEEIGSEVKGFQVGQAVAYMSMSAYSEHVCMPAQFAIPIPSAKAEFVSLLVSGLSAAIGLDMCGRIKEGEKVLVTAAAGGLGQIAVQWAKKAGCHVIGTCSSAAKARFLTELGCDFVINYKEQDLGQVLKEHYPDGLDVIWETIGGKVFETLTDLLAVRGRLVIIGAIEGYQTVGVIPVDISTLPTKLLTKASTICGFMLGHFRENFATYFPRLAKMVGSGELRLLMDDGKDTDGGRFLGLEGVTRAVQHLHSGKSSGKVFVTFE